MRARVRDEQESGQADARVLAGPACNRDETLNKLRVILGVMRFIERSASSAGRPGCNSITFLECNRGASAATLRFSDPEAPQHDPEFSRVSSAA